MHVSFTTTFSATECVLTINLGQYTSTLPPAYREMLTACVARKVQRAIALPRGLTIYRMTVDGSEIAVTLHSPSLSNGERMDAVTTLQDQMKAFIEPVAEDVLDQVGFVVQALALHAGQGSHSHDALVEQLRSLQTRVGVHYDRVTDIHRDLLQKHETLSARLAWVEAMLRTLPLIGHRFDRLPNDRGDA